jgi:hypothetical protein
MDREHNGDGRQWAARWQIDGDGRRGATAMDGAARRQWTARRQLDGEERRDGDLTMMDDEERRKRDGDVDTAGDGSNKGQRVITL